MTQSTRIVLEERLTIAQAAALHGSFCAMLAAGTPLVIDGSRVEEIDTAVLQLLCVVSQSAAQRGIACAWQGVSEALRRNAGLIGLSAALCFPEGNPGGGGRAAV